MKKRRVEQSQRELKATVAQLRESRSAIVPILTFAPEPYELLREIRVVVQSCAEEYLASFFDANINASGCTETEAVANLKEIMLSVYKHLLSLPTGKLGPGPKRQLAVLKEFIRRRPDNG